MATDKKKAKLAKGRHASTIKRDRQNIKLRAKNRQAMSKMKTGIKKVRVSKSTDDLNAVIPLIAKTAQKGIIHKRKAARLISRLTKGLQTRA